KARGIDVTCETGPHYIAFNTDTIKHEGNFRMNPPIKSPEDQKAIIEAIKDGTIDMIATDHAPHSLEEKSRGFDKSSFGVVGLETSFGVSYTELVKKNVISFERLIELMSVNPRKRFGLDGGYIENGEVADICIVDTETTWKVNPDEFQTKGRSTPFEGITLTGKVIATFVDGKLVYHNEKEI
ncbi:MAG: amidohydrolase family protein, partial [Solobacterium sp.]|nr:amidohydrolase family protein [Solobacterium sp.]